MGYPVAIMTEANDVRRAAFILRKCRQHLRRTAASLDLASARLSEGQIVELVSQHGELFDDDLRAGRSGTKLQEMLTEGHFLLLKVNLEVFLQLLARESWRCWLSRHRGSEKAFDGKVGKFLEERVVGLKAMTLADPTEYVLDCVVPSHGLGAFTHQLRLTGIDLKQRWKPLNTVFPQIYVAFEVRHLIEHSRGVADERFKRKVKEFWEKSSWCRQSFAGASRVRVDREDFNATFDAMMTALRAVEPDIAKLDDDLAALGRG